MAGGTHAWGSDEDTGMRILVAEPEASEGWPPRRSAAEGLATGAAASGEGRLRVERTTGLGDCIDRCLRERIDLVVVDEALGSDAEEIVARLRRAGAALVVLQRGTSEAASLAWFRRGAAECVVADRDFAALRHAVREQLERVRAVRGAAPGTAARAPAAHGILHNQVTALVGVDAAGRVDFANPAAEEILGASQAALRGRPFQDCLRDDSLGGETGRVAGEGPRAVETRVRRPDGSVVPVALSWGPLSGRGGAPGGAVAVLQDLSEVQAWRAHVLQTEKMASIGQLAAGVAHEINNPMGFIHANLFQMTEYVGDLRQVWTRVEGLLKAIEGGDPELLERSASELCESAAELDVGFVLQDLGKAIRESQEGSERIRHIVQDLRDFSHQDTGERVLADINQCLDSTANIVWPMMKHLVQLSKDYAELAPVPCYPMQLKQVFMNLLVNAYQAIEETAAQRPEAGPGVVTLTTRSLSDGVTVEITDTGIGIPPEHQARIFDPFFTTKKVGAGTGLGLSTSFNIVRRHGGTMRVESRRGAGTTFTIQLPMLRDSLGRGAA